ncbi:hypothetical protein F53441_12835 [Fusarium austroafricanum]|uniref:Methylated-DNA--protein-cysteine methyltransferase n=1 Tax=Fusarium austroafricanum TaxID=2364996 RepID=A0A8H4JSN0_9HYPO|nr:hypothetical protein F53441_12835 [Fusarium austroafricanum]
MAPITKGRGKRPPEEPQEDRKVKVSKTNKKSSPTTDYTAIMAHELALIEASTRTPFEKRVWTLLCQIPEGSFSTYGIMAAHLKSSPRAVGNALRRNPFAPEVPCHRVVATGGKLGGFKGKWPKDGEGITLDEKRRLLKGEGVRWDENGRVIGTPFGGFTDSV